MGTDAGRSPTWPRRLREAGRRGSGTLWSDHEACIWALGEKASDLGQPSVLEHVTHTFTMAFASAMTAHSKG